MTAPAPQIATGAAPAGAGVRPGERDASAAASHGGAGFAELLGGGVRAARLAGAGREVESDAASSDDRFLAGSENGMEYAPGSGVDALVGPPSAVPVADPFDGLDAAPFGDVEGRWVLSGPRTVPIGIAGGVAGADASVDPARVDIDAKAAATTDRAALSLASGGVGEKASVATPSIGTAASGEILPGQIAGAPISTRLAGSPPTSTSPALPPALSPGPETVPEPRNGFDPRVLNAPFAPAADTPPGPRRSAHAAAPTIDVLAGETSGGGSDTAIASAFAMRLAAASKGQLDDGSATDGGSTGHPSESTTTPVAAAGSGAAPSVATARAAPLAGSIATSDAPPLALDSSEAADDLAATVRSLAADGRGAARIELTPVELGSLSVDIERSGDRLAVGVHAANGATRDLVEALLPRLRELLSGDGIADVRVSVGDDGAKQDFARQGSGSGRGSERRSERGSGDWPDGRADGGAGGIAVRATCRAAGRRAGHRFARCVVRRNRRRRRGARFPRAGRERSPDRPPRAIRGGPRPPGSLGVNIQRAEAYA